MQYFPVKKNREKKNAAVSRETTHRPTKLPEWPLLSWHPYRKKRKEVRDKRNDAGNQQSSLTGEATSSALGASAAGAVDSVAGAVSVGLTSSTGTGVAVASTVDITIEIKGN